VAGYATFSEASVRVTQIQTSSPYSPQPAGTRFFLFVYLLKKPFSRSLGRIVFEGPVSAGFRNTEQCLRIAKDGKKPLVVTPK
jgi:hypothetical protein